MTTNHDTLKNNLVDGITLFEESVLKPDARLRNCARAQGCYEELMEVRQLVLEYIHEMREEALRG